MTPRRWAQAVVGTALCIAAFIPNSTYDVAGAVMMLIVGGLILMSAFPEDGAESEED